MDYNEILITEDTTVVDALKILDQTAKRILFVVRGKKLIAAISDGDIRRWILKKGKLTEPVSKLANYHPKALHVSDRINADTYMRGRHIQALPIINDNDEIVDILFYYSGDKSKHVKISVPVVIMAGGKGTRLYPYTKILPKPLIPIGDIPIAERIVNKFYECGCDEFWFIVNYRRNMIKAYFNETEKEYEVRFIDEDIPLGTGGGVSLLKGKISSTFILSNCDSIIDEDYSNILNTHKERGNLVTMICSLRNYEVPYGVVEIGENGSIKSMTEKPSMSFFTNTGTYIVEPQVIDYVEEGVSIGFPDIIQKIKNDGKNVGVYPINESNWLDMGQFDTMENMKEKLHIRD